MQSFWRFAFRWLGRSALVLLLVLPAAAQSGVTFTLMVMPFENHSKAPGADWLSEACSEVLVQRMESPDLVVVTRDERVWTFDRAGVPMTVRPTRATIFRVAEQLGVDYVVLGSYEASGTSFSASAQLLEVKGLKLHSQLSVSGPLADFVTLQTGLAWDLLRALPSPPAVSRQEFIQHATPIRLDAFENYVRAVVTTNRTQKVHYLKEALRLNPGYAAAAFELGSTYYDGHEYENAIVWLAKVPKDGPNGGEATFELGMSEYNRGSLDKAYSAFSSLVTRLPLTEVYNNLGVVDSRRGHRAAAVENFSKAVAADPSDPDYHFNLGVALFKNGDSVGASHQLKEALQLRPTDSEAKALLDGVSRGATVVSLSAPGGTQHVPIERIKRNYDEASYRQVEIQINNLSHKQNPK